MGNQNWTPAFAEEFHRRRGYDLLPYLPVFTGRIVESTEVSERVLWDVRRTVADLYAENYFDYFAELAHGSGLTLESEPYGDGPFEEVLSGRAADRVMGEFWWPNGGMENVRGPASIAHIYGKTIVGAESFTSTHGGWDMSPATMKALGDSAFAAGVNAFTFHRYAMQPWLDRWPGMNMGPWGSNLERTNTWWEQGRAWLEYIARCQFLLQQGNFVGDVLFFNGEGAPTGAVKPAASVLPEGYACDTCDADAILHCLNVRDGRLVLPNGASYRVLALPADGKQMTPLLLRKLKELADAGATILGPKPERSPSLSGYPACDTEVKTLAEAAWDGGKIISDQQVPTVLVKLGTKPDFEVVNPAVKFLYLHRQADAGDIYFVSNQAEITLEADCLFRVEGKTPELWHADTGKIEKVVAYSDEGGRTRIPLHLDPSGSVFVVFHDPTPEKTHPASLGLPTTPGPGNALEIKRAIYGVPNVGSIDVTAKLAERVRNGSLAVQVENSVIGPDPAPMTVKQLDVDYILNGKAAHRTVAEHQWLTLASPTSLFQAAELVARPDGVILAVREAGEYAVNMTDGRKERMVVGHVDAPLVIDGSWELRFPSGWGAPDQIRLDKLISWSECNDPGVRQFSGTATYHKTVSVPERWIGAGKDLTLDLGDVQVIAEVRLNGQNLGILWKPPYSVDITHAVKAGENDLEVSVTNLWANRMIGDEQLPEDSDRKPDSSLKSWPQWLLDGKPSPAGRFTFAVRRHWTKDDPLLPSGMLGPVMLRPIIEVPVH